MWEVNVWFWRWYKENDLIFLDRDICKCGLLVECTHLQRWEGCWVAFSTKVADPIRGIETIMLGGRIEVFHPVAVVLESKRMLTQV